MFGSYEGLQALILRIDPDALWTNRIIHREGLVTKHLCPPWKLLLENCAECGELYFLYAEPTPVIPHCALLLTLLQILAKRHCYNKQRRTCHIDGPFRDILAAGRRSTTKVTVFFQS